MTRIAVLAGFALALSPAAGFAQEAFRAERVEIEDFIGTVLVTVSEGGGSIAIAQGDEEHEVEYRLDGDILRIEGETSRRDRNWRRSFEDMLEDYPTITLVVAPGTDLELDDVAVKLKGGDLGGAFKARGQLFGSLGDVETARVGVSGSGDFKLGDVSGDLIGAISGSGNLKTGAVGGDADLSVSGSGSVAVGAISGGFEGSISGSGRIQADAVNGPTKASIAGSGDVVIKDGRAEDLRVSISGSGDFRFGGVAVNPHISVAGSGDISLGSYEGSLRTSGNADIRIGKKR